MILPLPVNDNVGLSISVKRGSNGKTAKIIVHNSIFANFLRLFGGQIEFKSSVQFIHIELLAPLRFLSIELGRTHTLIKHAASRDARIQLTRAESTHGPTHAH